MATLFVSDLHLDDARPHVSELFFDLLDGPAARAEALYILGDLFEVWIGDDHRTALSGAVAGRLRALAARGIPVFFVHGNRDFLLGAGYAAEAGIELLAETTVIDLYGTPTLVMHGDTLCTDDHAYQAFRQRVRDADWQRRMLARPLLFRRLLAAYLRRRSRRAQRGKAPEITDVNAGTVREALQRHRVRRLIHGHTHRPGRHPVALLPGQVQGERWVLGDWHRSGSLLCCDATGCRLQRWP